MKTTQYLEEILEELDDSQALIVDEQAEKLVNAIVASTKIFVAGAGRSGLMGKSFAMRLMHLGLSAFVIGETITPSFGQEDILIIGSGSGETKSLVSMAEKGKTIGGKLAVITLNPESSIGKLAHITIQLPGSPKDQTGDNPVTIQPMGSLFEQTLLLFYDAIILRIMEKKGLDTTKMYGKHANLE
jgi:6-phospho-3-hexuloisomerase